MRPVLSLITLISLTSAPAHAKLEVHEWGTFTSLVGSNGITQNGMYHEDELLPSFVNTFGTVRLPDQSRPNPFPMPPNCPRFSKFCMSQEFMDTQVVTQKMETPVIYFHSDVAQDVTVNVKFPKGVITETYPAPIATSPMVHDVTKLTNGETTFQVRLQPPHVKYDKIPFVDDGNIYSHARNVDANFVHSGSEVEKFIFYRGIGQYQPAFSISSVNDQLSIFAVGRQAPQIAYLIHVDETGDARLMKIRANEMRVFGGRFFTGRQIAQLRDHAAKADTVNNFGAILNGERVANEIVQGLTQAGLNEDEAKAMLATWEHGYLKVPGLRLLAILPRAEVDQILPLTVTPTPEKVERVFVSRIEILLQTDEDQIMTDVLRLGTNFNLATLGRFAEPKLRRAREVCVETGPCKDPSKLAVMDELVLRSQNLIEQPGSSSVQ